MHLDYELTIESQREFLSSKDRGSLQELFDLIDSNKDGLIDFYEVFIGNLVLKMRCFRYR